MSKVYLLNGNSSSARANSNEHEHVRTDTRQLDEAGSGERRIPNAVRAQGSILLVDNQLLRRNWIAQAVRSWGVAANIIEASSAADLASGFESADEAIVLAVISIGGADVTEPATAIEISWLRDHAPSVPIVVVGDRDDRTSVVAALRSGVQGFVPTTTHPNIARKALELVQAGGIYMPPASLIGAALPEAPSRSLPTCSAVSPMPESAARALDQLTPRQREVLELLGEGRPNKVIAQRLDMRESTVKVHMRQIMRKLGAANRTEVALIAHRLGAG